MTSATMLLLPMLATATVTVIRIEAEGGRPAVRLSVTGPRPPARVERQGPDLVLVLPGSRARPGLALPVAVAEIQQITLEEGEDALRLTMRIDGPFGFTLEDGGGEVTVALQPEGAPVPRDRRVEDVRELYRRILPPPPPPLPEELAATTPPPVPEPSPEAEGFQLGGVLVRPAVIASYVDADSAFLSTPHPIRDKYFQIEPRLALTAGTVEGGRGRLAATYSPRFRTSSEFEELRRSTHIVDATADMPIGSLLTGRAGYHFARGLLETTEVDPGREYFFRLGAFVRHQFNAAAVASPGGLVSYEVAASRISVKVDERSGFFDYDKDSVTGAVNYQFRESARAFFRYEWDRLPGPPERPLARARGSTYSIGLAGDVAPLVTGTVLVGLRTLEAPLAGEGGTRFRGTTGDVNLKKEFTPGTSVTLTGHRGTHPSGYEANAFYVATSGGVLADVALPLSVVFHGAVAVQRNTYAVTAVPPLRRDDLLGWTVGVGRSLTHRAFVRADYRMDRRTSTVPGFDYDGHTFVVGIGIGFLTALPPGLGAR